MGLQLEEEQLYQKVKNEICRQIYTGVYADGDRIPSERQLSEDLGVSRVTVRRALQVLEKEQIISRIQGSGTRVSMYYGARKGNMDIITLVASAQNEFFSNFMEAFQLEAEQWDSLVLYKQKTDRMSLEKCLYQIYEKGLRNVVLWTEQIERNEETFRIMKGLGLNLVLFDEVNGGKYADSVCLDNQDAIVRLHRQLKEKGCTRIGYVEWSDHGIGSLRVRKETFRKLEPEGVVQCVPYEYHNHLQRLSVSMIEKILDSLKECDGILYAVGELGSVLESYAKRDGKTRYAAAVGETSETKAQKIISIAQDYTGMAKQIFRCLQRQNSPEDNWSASSYYVKGRQRF